MRFLIVDDDESALAYLGTALSPYAECDGVLSGNDAVIAFDKAQADGRPYDAVLMDILMPGMDGHQTAEILRAREEELGVDELHAFKLVMVSSLVDDANVTRAFFSTQAVCYLVKPLEKEKVLEELRQNLVI
ncbi:response regulator [Pseudodesulfovibrio sp.]|uniref:response regulator n=1 Tax=unclassified Pseudodesulfovibrio TaxID=2661612 RepID=UPI003B004971